MRIYIIICFIFNYLISFGKLKSGKKSEDRTTTLLATWPKSIYAQVALVSTATRKPFWMPNHICYFLFLGLVRSQVRCHWFAFLNFLVLTISYYFVSSTSRILHGFGVCNCYWFFWGYWIGDNGWGFSSISLSVCPQISIVLEIFGAYLILRIGK